MTRDNEPGFKSAEIRCVLHMMRCQPRAPPEFDPIYELRLAADTYICSLHLLTLII